MNTTSSIALWVTVALIVGGIAGYYVGRAAPSGNEISSSATSMMTTVGSSDKAAEFQMAMRKLWTDHTMWTRDYIIAAVAGAPDVDIAAKRLLQNQTDIGNAIAPYYGTQAASQLTALLKQHIMIAADLISAAKANNTAKMTADQKQWQDNANQIADFLAGANPNWSKVDLRAMMKKHLDTTTGEVTARLHKDWAADVKAYDAVYDHILGMADTLSAGVIKQFPNKF